ncbi:MAG TPA: DUF3108 domain-containing protein [Anaeromyxobacteraceae bacterium]|nr:DUF3108 domain-containing protein [Anaeromyxobacteraceae bacterium]
MISAAIAALALAATPCTLPPLGSGPRPWRAGESLAWDVDVMGIATAGTIETTVDAPAAGVVPVRVRVKNTSVFAKVRHIRGVATSWIDATTLLPRRYRDETVEENGRRTTEVRFDDRGPHLRLAWTFNDRRGIREVDRTGVAMDLVSLVYYLRAAELKPGQRFCADLVANRRYWRLEGTVAETREPVDTPAGTFQTIRVDTMLTRQPTPDDPKVRSRPLHLWLSDDTRRVPVAGVTEVDLGPVRALLSRGAGSRAAPGDGRSGHRSPAR